LPHPARSPCPPPAACYRQGVSLEPTPVPAREGEDDQPLEPVPPAEPVPAVEPVTAPTTAGPAYPRLAALLEVIACSGFPTQFALAAVLGGFGVRPFDAAGRLSAAYVFALSLADAAAILLMVAWFLRLHGEGVREVLFGRRPVAGEGLLGVLQIPIVFLLVLVVMAAIQVAVPGLHNVARNPFEGLIRSTAEAWLFTGVAIIGGGVREEVQRAFILHRFGQHLGGAWLGLVVFSAVFGLGHVIQGWDVALTTAVLGFFWGAVYIARRSIASTVVSHSGFNAAEIFRYTLYGA
jgi:membrane protease YdiL (CAAX protease family)